MLMLYFPIAAFIRSLKVANLTMALDMAPYITRIAIGIGVMIMVGGFFCFFLIFNLFLFNLLIICIHLNVLFCQCQSAGLPAIETITFSVCMMMLEWSVLYVVCAAQPTI